METMTPSAGDARAALPTWPLMDGCSLPAWLTAGSIKWGRVCVNDEGNLEGDCHNGWGVVRLGATFGCEWCERVLFRATHPPTVGRKKQRKKTCSSSSSGAA